MDAYIADLEVYIKMAKRKGHYQIRFGTRDIYSRKTNKDRWASLNEG